MAAFETEARDPWLGDHVVLVGGQVYYDVRGVSPDVVRAFRSVVHREAPFVRVDGGDHVFSRSGWFDLVTRAASNVERVREIAS